MTNWIDWPGGECPVAADAEVAAMISFPTWEGERIYRADDLLWNKHETPEGFIFRAYRLVVPPPTFADIAAKDAEIERLRDVLLRNGFVPCDTPACNCGSWHARFGLRERFTELTDDLAEAGHPLCNENGNLARRALWGLVDERDRLRAELAQARDVATGRIAHIYEGECPSPEVGQDTRDKHCPACQVLLRINAAIKGKP